MPIQAIDAVTVDPDPPRSNPIGSEASGPNADVSGFDPETALKWLRDETTRDVHSANYLLFEHLGLTESEQAALSEFLVKVWMSTTRMPNYQPEPIEEQERLDEDDRLVTELAPTVLTDDQVRYMFDR